MAFILNDKIKNLKPYDPICGEYPVRLDANESFLLPPVEIKEKILDAINKAEINRYPDSTAKAVCNAFAQYYDLDPQLLVAGNGSDELISVIMNAFLEKGDTVVTLSPDFSMYAFYASLCECTCIAMPKDESFKVDFDQVIRTVKENAARMVIFSNPCNPTSVGFLKDDVRRLVQETDALIVLDEAYMDFWDQSLLEEIREYDNLIILKTCSKAVGFASVRLGFAIANPVLINVLRAAKSPYNVNSLTQAAASALLTEKQYLQDAVAQILASTKELYTQLKALEARIPDQIKVFETNTNFISVQTASPQELFDFLKSKGIIVRKFDRFVRITAGTKAENEACMAQIKNYYGV